MFELAICIRIYLAILAKLLKLLRFDSINYLPSVREWVKDENLFRINYLPSVREWVKDQKIFVFDSFPDRRQVVYTVETLEFQKFSQNS